MPLLDYALTSVVAAKEYLKISVAETSEDTLIESLVNAVTDQIEAYCNRKLKERVVVDEEFDGMDSDTLILPDYPLSSVSSVKIDGVLVDAAEYKLRKGMGAIVRLKSKWPKGVLNLQVSYTAGYANVPANLELACKHTVMFYYKTDVANFSRTYGEGFVLRPDALPRQTQMLLAPYRKVLV